MAISGFRTDPGLQSPPSAGISGTEAGPSATQLDNDTPRSPISQMISAEREYFSPVHNIQDSDAHSESYSEDEGSLGYTQPPDEFMGRFGSPRDRSGQESAGHSDEQHCSNVAFDALETASGIAAAETTARVGNPAKSASVGVTCVGAIGRVKTTFRPKRRKWWQIRGLHKASGVANQESSPSMIRNGRYAIHADWYGHLLQWAGPQFQPSVFPFAAPESCYRHNGKWFNQPKGAADMNGGFAIPWGDESLFLMPPIGDCH